MPAKLGRKPRAWKKAALLRVHGAWCWLCDRAGEPDDLTIDHVRPLSLGGSHAFANLRLAHRGCNAARASGPPPELLLTVPLTGSTPSILRPRRSRNAARTKGESAKTHGMQVQRRFAHFLKSVSFQKGGPMAEWLRRGLQSLRQWRKTATLSAGQQLNSPMPPDSGRAKVKRLFLVAAVVVAAAIWLLPGLLLAEAVVGLGWCIMAVVVAKLMIWRATHPDDNQLADD